MVVHLNIHSSYDLLHSTVNIEELVLAVKAAGQQAAAITDLNVLFGVQSFYRTCIKHGIKPIIGMEVRLSDGLDTVSTILLAKSNDGFNQLMKLSSRINLKHLETVGIDMLSQYTDDLVVILKNIHEGQDHFHEKFKTVYMCHESKGSIPAVYVQPVNYIKPDGIASLEVLQAIDDNKKLALEALSLTTGMHYFRTEEIIRELGINDALIAETEEIADMCHVEIKTGITSMPKFPVPNGMTSDDYLWHLLTKRKRQYPHFNEAYEERLKYEFDIIKNMGFSDYFLIVGDLIQYAKERGILVGPGRGSAGGSLISYVMNITTVDPIAHDLLFERFLNPERITMPDIDIDFQDTRRDEVIDYCIEKYGQFYVSGIVTFGHLLARAVMRDVGRILQFSEAELKMVSQLIPKKLGITLDEALENDDFDRFVNENERRKRWFKIAYSLEGLPRHTSTHAAGIIIHDKLLTDFVPLIQGDDIPLTQWTMTEVESIGLLKIDFLGLRNLTIIQNVQRMIKRQFNQTLDLDTIPHDDKEVFQMLSRSDTTGIFQLESDGIRQVLRRLKPDHFDDITAVLALYRPGPMEQIPLYISRRHQKEAVTYLHEDLKPILEPTYGVIIYQEQIMQIANQFAGFSYGEADILRRAMSKKNKDALLEERVHFINGSLKNGYSKDTAEAIYDLILKFANYGFNKAHAVSYAEISYMMLYLKVHYPTFFYAAILSNVTGNEQKTKEIITELKTRNIKIFPPDINRANWYYSAVNEGIIMSLGMIKGMGYKSVQEIIKAREAGPFTDMYDFASRLPGRIKTRALFESLIHVGAFDVFKENRATMLASIDMVLDIEKDSNSESNFLETLGLSRKKVYQYHDEMPDDKKSQYEMQYAGFYLTEHPVEHLFNEYQYLPLYQFAQKQSHQYILVYIDNLRRIRTKKGQQMAFAEAMDGIYHINLVIFPIAFKKYEHLLHTDTPLVIKGKFDSKNDDQYLVDEVMTLDDFKTHIHQTGRQLYIRNETVGELLRENDTAENEIEVIAIEGNETVKKGSISREELPQWLEKYKKENIRLL